MALKQIVVPLDDTIGGITFYKAQDGYLAREKGGVEADRSRSGCRLRHW